MPFRGDAVLPRLTPSLPCRPILHPTLHIACPFSLSRATHVPTACVGTSRQARVPGRLLPWPAMCCPAQLCAALPILHHGHPSRTPRQPDLGQRQGDPSHWQQDHRQASVPQRTLLQRLRHPIACMLVCQPACLPCPLKASPHSQPHMRTLPLEPHQE